MKKTALILALCLLLSACTVGPEEKPRDFITSDDVTSADIPAAPDAPLNIEEPVAPDIPPEEPVVTEPATEAPAPEETTAPQTEPPEDDPVETEEGMTNIGGEDVLTDPDYSGGIIYPTISLNVRSGPATSYERLGHVDEGEPCTAILRTDDWEWYLIEFRGGTGWIGGAYVSEDPPAEPPEEEETPEDNSPEEDNPEIPTSDSQEQLSENAEKTIIADYAKATGAPSSVIRINNYFGSFDAGEAVVMYRTDMEYTDDIKEFTVGNYKFWLSSGSLSLTIHTPTGEFVPLSDAYESGTITDDDLAAISLKMRGEIPDLPDIPTSDPQKQLSEDTEKKIIADYAKATGAPASVIRINNYYGSFDAGEAVVMYRTDVEYTDDIKEFTVGNYKFWLSSGGLSLTIHTPSGEFVSLREAYENGAITDADLAAISSAGAGVTDR